MRVFGTLHACQLSLVSADFADISTPLPLFFPLPPASAFHFLPLALCYRFFFVVTFSYIQIDLVISSLLITRHLYRHISFPRTFPAFPSFSMLFIVSSFSPVNRIESNLLGSTPRPLAKSALKKSCSYVSRISVVSPSLYFSISILCCFFSRCLVCLLSISSNLSKQVGVAGGVYLEKAEWLGDAICLLPDDDDLTASRTARPCFLSAYPLRLLCLRPCLRQSPLVPCHFIWGNILSFHLNIGKIRDPFEFPHIDKKIVELHLCFSDFVNGFTFSSSQL